MRKFNIKAPFLYRVVFCLVALALISTALFCYVNARYTVVNSTSSDASVTNWGFTADMNGENMFSGHYAGGVRAEAELDDHSYDVRAKAESTVVAPDTSGYLSFTLKGDAEVSAQIVFEATGRDIKVTEGGGAPYRPIKWSLDVIENSVVTNVISNATIEQLIEEIESFNPVINAGESVDIEYRISWLWAIETGNTPAEIEKNNTLDSVIAAYLAEYTVDAKYDISAAIKFDLIATVEQVN